ncbi:MAG TPA: EAL domain-containing protein [Frankiaceae bacterium]|jgi:diguanylate cyclase (GGDEF)-like protein/PAS domain S-box-containing protein|nr:EAL domain-containing protein [Frankiaceae bacterium]
MESHDASGPTTPGAPALRRLVATDGDFVLTVTPEGRLLAASESVQTVLGWDLAECAVGGILTAIVDEGQQAAMRHVLKQVVTFGGARSTLQLSAARGRLWVDVAAKQLTDQPGSPIHISARDVSDDLAAARELAASEQQWRVAFEHSPIGGAMLSTSGAILVANKALARMVGWRVHELTHMDVTEIVESQGGLPWQEWWEGLLSGNSESHSTDRTLVTADGERLWSRLTGAVVVSTEGDNGVILQFEDVTSRRQAELELANRALHDGLTGAPNRFLTHQWLGSALDDSPGSRVGVLYCDLDRFKIVNDSLGHAAGDSLLTQVADRLRAVLRPEDLLGRVGGDEFVVIVEGVRTTAELADVASRMAEALDEPFELGGHRHAVTLSLGGSVGAHPDTADEVLMRADMALLRAKRLGRARYVAFDVAHDRVTTREDLQLEDDLRTSFGSEQLRAFYQPIVSLGDLVVVGHEALVRWEHPSHGLLPPDRFLELAESSGLIRPLGGWMLAQACQDAARDAAGLAPGGWVAVNVSPSQLARSGFADNVISMLDKTGLSPSRLHLEVTETALIAASATLSDELEQLSRLGVRIGLDDFGTGYSSLSLLQKFPVHMVKIDRSFVQPVLEDRSARAIVKAVLSMCDDMGLPTVAEGIEDQDQLELLRELGCSHGQGYLFGRPIPLRARIVIPRQKPHQPTPDPGPENKILARRSR